MPKKHTREGKMHIHYKLAMLLVVQLIFVSQYSIWKIHEEILTFGPSLNAVKRS